MKIRNIICAFTAAAAMAAFSGAAVYGDMIAEPDNSFYYDNYESCEYIESRPFEALEDAKLLKDPNGKAVSKDVRKGDKLNISFTYTDKSGEVWGCCMFYGSADADSDGWIKMSQVKEI